MGKPRMIILIRHAQSEGNKNRDIHQNIPDHRVKLTPDGWAQAHEAGKRLRSMLRADDTLHFFTSPYRRTRETTEGILSTLTSDNPSPSPFPRRSIKVYEEPRLREQDFGNFQPCSAEMERMWQERADYGHFFYRIPNGESAADAYDRVSGFNESLWRQFGEDDCASVCVLVTHGLMSRVFLMKWYHFSVEYFEDLRNVNHCEFLIMRKKEDSGKYILENKLRTWSELKRERSAAAAAAAAAAVKDKAKEDSDKEKDLSKADRLERSITHGTPVSAIPKRKQWGGCPNGCDHGRHYYKKENSMHAMQANGRASEPGSAITPTTSATNTPVEAPPIRRPFALRFQSSSEDENDPRGRLAEKAPPAIDVQKSLQNDGVPGSASLDSTPSSMPTEERLKLRVIKSPEINLVVAHLGRDFGGSKSGNTSRAGSDSEAVEGGDECNDHSHGHSHGHPKIPKSVPRKKDKSVAKRRGKGEWHGESGMGRGAKANALGDQSDVGSDGGSEGEGGDGENHTGSGDEVVCQEEIEGKSFRGSVL